MKRIILIALILFLFSMVSGKPDHEVFPGKFQSISVQGTPDCEQIVIDFSSIPPQKRCYFFGVSDGS